MDVFEPGLPLFRKLVRTAEEKVAQVASAMDIIYEIMVAGDWMMASFDDKF